MIAEPRCSIRKCKFFLGVAQPTEEESSEIVICQAYPLGIPKDIAYGRSLHKTVREDQDNNITYKVKGGK